MIEVSLSHQGKKKYDHFGASDNIPAFRRKFRILENILSSTEQGIMTWAKGMMLNQLSHPGTPHFGFLCMVLDKSSTSFFCTWLSSSPCIVCWKGNSFPHWIVLTSLAKINWALICGLYLDTDFYSLGLYVYLLTTLWLCNNFCNQGVWILQFCFVFSTFFKTRLFWLFRLPCNSIWILGSACQFL